jgi:ParB family chromosome partitioning protein
LFLAFAGTNLSVASRASDNPHGHAKCGPHAARLIGEDGKLSFDCETLEDAARSVLGEVLSLRRNAAAFPCPL